MINFAYVVFGLCIITFVCRWRKLKDAEHILMIVTSMLGAILVLGLTLPDDKIPAFITREVEVLDVDTSGIMVLEAGSYNSMQSYYLNGDIDIEKLQTFLHNNKRGVALAVKDGDTNIYHKNLGLLDESYADDIIDLYDKWQSTGKIKSGYSKYSFFIFYIKR